MAESAHSDLFWERIREADEFFEKRGKVHTALERLTRRLDAEDILYAVMGGMALNLHGYVRITNNLDLLITSPGLERFTRRFMRQDYTQPSPDKIKFFLEVASQVPIRFFIAGEYPGDGKPKPVVFPDPGNARVEIDGLWVLTLEKLIELKLASGLSAAHRLKDLSDVQELIGKLGLLKEFGEKLDPSVRAEYRRLWETAQHAGDGPHERE